MPNRIISSKSAGFTLVELMIAVTVIALMSTVGLVVYGQVKNSAQDSKRMSDVEEIRKAVETYHLSTGNYPVALSSANSYFERGATPKDPNGSDYIYSYKTEKYLVCATLTNCGTKCTNNGVTSSTDPTTTSVGTQGASGATQYCVGN